MSKLRALCLIQRRTLKQGLLAFLAILSLGLLTACSKYFGDAKRSTTHMQVPTQMTCFNQVGQTLSDYVAGKVPLAQMDSLIACTTNAVDEFTNKVVGSAGRANTYDRNDISMFLDQYLLASGKFDHELLARLFDLKASSMTGDANSISPADIAMLKALLSDIRTSMHEVDPYLGVLTKREKMDPQSAVDQKRFEAALVAFRSAINRLTPYFAPTRLRQKTFTMDEGFDLLASLGLDMKKYQPYKDLTLAAKQILVGGAPAVIRADEWLTLIKNAVDAYALYLRYQTYVVPLALTDSAVTPQLHKLGDEGLAFLLKAIRRQSAQVITEAQLQQAINGLATAKLLPARVGADALIEFLPTVVEKWLLDRTVATPLSSHGIGLSEYNMIAIYTQSWLAGLDLMQAVSPDQTVTQAQLSENLRAQKAITPIQLAALSEWSEIFAQGRPWAWTAEGSLIIALPRTLPPLTRDNLFAMNSWRLIGEAVLRTYAQDPTRSKTLAGLTSDEVQQAYLDIRGISNDLRLIDPRTFNAGSRTFMETNLFTSAANGDSLMQYREAVDWLNSAISSTEQGTRIYNDVETRCAPTARTDLLGHRQMEDSCFRTELRKGFVSYFPNFPNLVSYFKQSLRDDASWTTFIEAFETIARPVGPIEGPIDLGAVRTLVTVMGYNESLFLRFDADENQLLTDKELWAAFPLVQPHIQVAMAKPVAVAFVRGQCPVSVIAPVSSPPALWLQQAVFAYLIRNGHPPPTSGLGTLGVPFAYAQSYILSAKLSRTNLIKILAGFTTVTNQKNTAAIEDFYKSQAGTLEGDILNGVCTVTQKILELFKCDPTAQSALTTMVKARGTQIFTGANQTAADFTARLEQQLQNDAALRGVCLPF